MSELTSGNRDGDGWGVGAEGGDVAGGMDMVARFDENVGGTGGAGAAAGADALVGAAAAAGDRAAADTEWLAGAAAVAVAWATEAGGAARDASPAAVGPASNEAAAKGAVVAGGDGAMLAVVSRT